MTFFSQPTALPGIARILVAVLATQPDPVPRERLLAAVAPPTLHDPPLGAESVETTLAVCRSIGLLAEEAEGVRLTVEVPNQAMAAGLSRVAFRRLVRQVLLGGLADTDVWAADTNGRDLARALAWFLAQDPLHPFCGWGRTQHGQQDPERAQSLLGHNRLIRNNAQWNAFCRWVHFLGLGVPSTIGESPVLVADPTDAVREELDQFPSGSQGIMYLLEGLAARLPVLDYGAVRRQVDARVLPHPTQRAGGVWLSPALSLALLRLEREGQMILDNPHDSQPDQRRTLRVGSPPTGREHTVSLVHLAEVKAA